MGTCLQCGAVCVYPECGGTCAAAPPAAALRSVSLALGGVNFGTGTTWPSIGFNLDGKCTTNTSVDVCALQAGSPKSVQDDGTGGIDNSYGENICPIAESFSSGACSNLQSVYVITDGMGDGTIAIPMNGNWLDVPIHDTFVVPSGNGGVLGAVAPTAGVVAAYQAVAGSISASLCSGSAWQSIAAQLAQASDILSNGSDDVGSACDSISIGLTYTSSAQFAGPIPPANNPCANDAGTD